MIAPRPLHPDGAIFQHQIRLVGERLALGPGGVAIVAIVQLVDADGKFLGLPHQLGALVLPHSGMQTALLPGDKLGFQFGGLRSLMIDTDHLAIKVHPDLATAQHNAAPAHGLPILPDPGGSNAI